MKKELLITGSAGLVGSSCARFFAEHGFGIWGVDNNMRRAFFGPEASVAHVAQSLVRDIPRYTHCDSDIRNRKTIEPLFKEQRFDLIIHAAAQPSHEWALQNPDVDFDINTNGTRLLLEYTRMFCPEAVFIFISTNKVYGDRPNSLPLVEGETRFDLPAEHPDFGGIDESMSIDDCMHSMYGASKLAADILVQEYGKYFGMKTAVFRAGCITGPQQKGVPLHGFLSYLVRTCLAGKRYAINGYKGKQVRDNIHAGDLASAFYQYYQNPRRGEVFNIGGGRALSLSILEAIELTGRVCGKKLEYEYHDTARKGDHMWWITDTSKFKKFYPQWRSRYSIEAIIEKMVEKEITLGAGERGMII